MTLKMCTWLGCVSNPELLPGETFLFIMIVLNLAAFSCGGGGGLCNGAEHLQTVKASCSRKFISGAAGQRRPAAVEVGWVGAGLGGAREEREWKK